MQPTHCHTAWPVKIDFNFFTRYVRGFSAGECADAIADLLADTATAATSNNGALRSKRKRDTKKASTVAATALGALLHSSDECRSFLLEEVKEQYLAFRRLEARDEFLHDPRSFLTTNVDSIPPQQRAELLEQYYFLEPLFFRAVFGLKLPNTHQFVLGRVNEFCENHSSSPSPAAPMMRPSYIVRQAQSISRVASVLDHGYSHHGNFSREFSCVDAIAENFQISTPLAWQYATLVFAAKHKLNCRNADAKSSATAAGDESGVLCFSLIPSVDMMQSLAHVLMTSMCTDSKLFISEALREELGAVGTLLGNSTVAGEIVKLAAYSLCSATPLNTAPSSPVVVPSSLGHPPLSVDVTGSHGGGAAAAAANNANNHNRHMAPPLTPAASPSGAVVAAFPRPASSPTLLAMAGSTGSSAVQGSGSSPAATSGSFQATLQQQQHDSYAAVSQQLARLVKSLCRACTLFSGGGLQERLQSLGSKQEPMAGFVAEIERMFFASSSGQQHQTHAAQNGAVAAGEGPGSPAAGAGGSAFALSFSSSPLAPPAPVAGGGAVAFEQHQHQRHQPPHSSSSPSSVSPAGSFAAASNTPLQQLLLPAPALSEVRRLLQLIRKTLSAPSVTSLSVSLVGQGPSFGDQATLESAYKVIEVATVMCTMLQASLFL